MYGATAGDDLKTRPQSRAAEAARFLPVIFVIVLGAALYIVYVVLHLVPLLQPEGVTPAVPGGVPTLPGVRASTATFGRGVVQAVGLHVALILFVTSFARALLTPAGEIPATPEWLADDEGDFDVAADPTDKAQTASQQRPVTSALISTQHDNITCRVSCRELKTDGSRRQCKWCLKFKPDRSHHCRVCQQCTLAMDHHCIWLANCVGAGNRKYFLLTVLYGCISTHLLFWGAFSTTWAAVVAGSDFPIQFALVFLQSISGLLAVLLTCFLIFHVGLASKNLTTIEFCEKVLGNKTNFKSGCYDKGLVSNWYQVLGSNVLLWLLPVGSSQWDGLSWHRPGDHLMIG